MKRILTQPNTPKILALETSGQSGSVAIVTPGSCLAEYSLETHVTHSRRLLVNIEQLLSETALDWPDISALAVSLGPGSFTGLRIGLSTAKGLAMATKIPIIGVPTLDALACQLINQPQQICAINDARKKEVYCAFYDTDKSGNIQRKSEICAIKPADLAAGIKETTIFIGDGINSYGEMLKEILAEKAIFAPPELYFPRAAAVGLLGLKQWSMDNFLDTRDAAPIYVRKSEAEILFGSYTKTSNRIDKD